MFDDNAVPMGPQEKATRAKYNVDVQFSYDHSTQVHYSTNLNSPNSVELSDPNPDTCNNVHVQYHDSRLKNSISRQILGYILGPARLTTPVPTRNRIQNTNQSPDKLIFLLSAALLTSIVNTLVLALVVKSIQTDDYQGVSLDGQIGGSTAEMETLLELPAIFGMQSISSEWIEPIVGGDLIILEGWQQQQQHHRNKVEHNQELNVRNGDVVNGKRHNQAEGVVATTAIESDGGSLSMLFTTAEPEDQLLDGDNNSHHRHLHQNQDRLRHFNYIALGLSDCISSPPTRTGLVEIGTRNFSLNLIRPNFSGLSLSSTDQVELKLPSRSTKYKWQRNRKQMIANQREQQQQQQATIEPVIQIRDDTTWVGAMHKDLRMSQMNSDAISVEGQMKAAAIVGSLGDNLHIQSQSGNLEIRADAKLRFVSKSSHVRLTSVNDLVISSPKIVLKSGNLYIAHGISYFDSSSDDQDEQVDPSPDDIPFAGKDIRNNDGPQLRAHSLATVGGRLVAVPIAR